MLSKTLNISSKPPLADKKSLSPILSTKKNSKANDSDISPIINIQKYKGKELLATN